MARGQGREEAGKGFIEMNEVQSQESLVPWGEDITQGGGVSWK